jgi:hypothetical protein
MYVLHIIGEIKILFVLVRNSCFVYFEGVGQLPKSCCFSSPMGSILENYFLDGSNLQVIVSLFAR